MQTRPLLSIAIQLAPPTALGELPGGERRLAPFTNGRFEGIDGLRGVVAPGGVEWQTVRSDRAVELRAHFLLIADAGESIEVTWEGLRVATPGVTARLAAGAPVDANEYYFRAHVRLTTSAPRWERLNRLIAISTGEHRPDDVAVHIHEVL